MYRIILLLVFAASACIQTEIVPEVLEPKLQIIPSNVSLLLGDTFQMNGTYTDEAGKDVSHLLQWSSAGPSIVSVDDAGLLTALSSGQSWVIAEAPGGLADSALITVTADLDMVGTVEVSASQNTLEAGETMQLQARALNAVGEELAGKEIVWNSSNPGVLSVSQDGIATGLNPGLATVSASADGIMSLPFPIEVIPSGGLSRSGQFSGNSGYSVKGTATLRQEGAGLVLILESDFMSSSGPGLGVYLAKTASGGLNSQNSVSLGNLQSTNGMQQYAVPSSVSLADFDYAVIYCIPFNIRFGTAQLQ